MSQKEELSEALFPYFRVLAHDMASPLTTILGYTQLILSGLEPEQEEMREDLEEIETSAHLLKKRINQLGRFSRSIPTEQHCSALELVEDVVQLATAAARRHECALSLHTEQAKFAPNTQVQGNPWELRLCLLALIGLCLQEPRVECSFTFTTREKNLLVSLPAKPGRESASPRWEQALARLQSGGAKIFTEDGAQGVLLPLLTL
jgi:light-regulated signal transduction histidine kinase (bacteriophytochrome)